MQDSYVPSFWRRLFSSCAGSVEYTARGKAQCSRSNYGGINAGEEICESSCSSERTLFLRILYERERCTCRETLFYTCYVEFGPLHDAEDVARVRDLVGATVVVDRDRLQLVHPAADAPGCNKLVHRTGIDVDVDDPTPNVDEVVSSNTTEEHKNRVRRDAVVTRRHSRSSSLRGATPP